MPEGTVVLLLVPPFGGFSMLLKPAGTATTGIPTRFPRQTSSQSVKLPMNALTVKLSLTSSISFPRARCACPTKVQKIM
jgi:hypothetical protein